MEKTETGLSAVEVVEKAFEKFLKQHRKRTFTFLTVETKAEVGYDACRGAQYRYMEYAEAHLVNVFGERHLVALGRGEGFRGAAAVDILLIPLGKKNVDMNNTEARALINEKGKNFEYSIVAASKGGFLSFGDSKFMKRRLWEVQYEGEYSLGQFGGTTKFLEEKVCHLIAEGLGMDRKWLTVKLEINLHTPRTDDDTPRRYLPGTVKKLFDFLVTTGAE